MSSGDQAGALSRLKFTNHSDCSGALGSEGEEEGGSRAEEGGVSFDALNKKHEGKQTNKKAATGRE